MSARTISFRAGAGLLGSGALIAIAASALLMNCCAHAAGQPAPLTAVAGDAELGEKIFTDRDTGHCVLCHSVQTLAAPSQGNLGPALDNVGARLNAAELRLRLIDSTQINPDSAMPAYYKSKGLNRVAPRYANHTVLSAQQIEDLVAYLLTLRTSNNE